MAAFNKVNAFVESMAEKKFDLGADSLKVALTNAVPGSFAVLADLAQISYTNCSSRVITTTSSAQIGGTYKLVLQDLTLTASGGDVGPFRYIWIYDDTAAADDLIGYYDYGSSITLHDTETLLIDFDAAAGFLTNA